MTTFIWTVVVLFSIEVFGKAIILSMHNYERKPKAMLGDIVISLGMLVWAAWLLGNNA